MAGILEKFVYFIRDAGSNLSDMIPGTFLKLVNLSITASWLVLAVLLLRMVIKKTPKWIHCAMWGLVGIRLVFPFSLESMFSLVPSAETFEQEMIHGRRFEINTGIEVLDTRVNEYMGSRYYEGVTAPTGFKLDVTTVLAVIWLIGVTVMLGYALVSYLKLKKDMQTSVLLDRKGMHLGTKIRQSEKVGSPFVLGLFRPVIYLPYEVSGADMEYVIAHEEAHIKRKDHWIKPVGFLILSVYWFHPLLWAAYVMLCKDIELACDEKVIGALDRAHRQAYSLALLNCSMKRYRIAACPLAFGEVSVKERVKGVMNYKKPGFWMVVIGLVVCVAVAVFFLTDPVNDGQYAQESSEHNTTESAALRQDEGEENNTTTEHEDGKNMAASQDENSENTTEAETQGGENNDDNMQERIENEEQELENQELEGQVSSGEKWISEAILEYNKERYPKGEFACESHILLGSQQIISTPAVGESHATIETIDYMLVYYQVYSTYGGELKEEGGSCMPVKLTSKMDLGNSEKELVEYWEPRSGGADYVKEIKDNFPEQYVEGFLNTQEYAEKLRQECYDKAYVYLEENGSVDERIEILLKGVTSVPLHASMPQEYSELMEEEYEQLAAYGEFTLRYCFTEFLKGAQTDLRGHIMAQLCQEIMPTMGEAFIIEYEPATGQEWFDAFLSSAHTLKAQYDDDTLQKYYPASRLVLDLEKVQ